MAEPRKTVEIKFYYGEDAVGFYWPNSAQKRKELFDIKRNDPATFEAVYQGRPGKRIGAIFLKDDFDYYQPPADLGLGVTMPSVREFVAQGHAIFQAWDTAFSTSDQAAHSVCVTGMFVPCDRFHRGENPEIIGECDNHFDVVVLDVYREKLDWGALTNQIKRLYYTWQPQAVLIEKRATGISLVQTLPSSNIPVIGIEVGSASKGERAVNKVDARGAGSVQGWCRQHRIKFPIEAPWLKEFEDELKDFSGENDSSSDQVNSFVHLVTHAIRLSTQSMLLPTGTTIKSISAQETNPIGSTDGMTDLLLHYVGEGLNNAADLFYGMCGGCNNQKNGYCKIQLRNVVSMDSCFEYTDGEVTLY